MLTLGDIDALFPKTSDGSLYSDFHKDTYGFRPHGVTFESLEDFESSWKILVEAHNAEMERYYAAGEDELEERIMMIINLMKCRSGTILTLIADE